MMSPETKSESGIAAIDTQKLLAVGKTTLTEEN